MSAPSTTARFLGSTSTSQSNRWIAFVAAALAVNLLVFVFCPNLINRPLPSKQVTTFWAAIAICCFPLFVGLVELLFYRTLAERVVSYLSLGLSLLYLVVAMDAGVEVWCDWKFEQYLSGLPR